MTPAAVLGVVVGAPGPADGDPWHWRGGTGPVVHDRAETWLGPWCNLGADPAVTLIAGQEVEAGRVTCWACRHRGGQPCADDRCGPCRRERGA